LRLLKLNKAMNEIRQWRGWGLVAVIAIVAALALMLVPHSHAGDAGEWLAILPLLFVCEISPLSLLSPLAHFYLGRTPDAPALPAWFQRPPPFAIA
jgi:cell division protein FtsW (lipid II flippase)